MELYKYLSRYVTHTLVYIATIKLNEINNFWFIIGRVLGSSFLVVYRPNI